VELLAFLVEVAALVWLLARAAGRPVRIRPTVVAYSYLYSVALVTFHLLALAGAPLRAALASDLANGAACPATLDAGACPPPVRPLGGVLLDSLHVSLGGWLLLFVAVTTVWLASSWRAFAVLNSMSRRRVLATLLLFCVFKAHILFATTSLHGMFFD
jgi:hypothetical protein